MESSRYLIFLAFSLCYRPLRLEGKHSAQESSGVEGIEDHRLLSWFDGGGSGGGGGGGGVVDGGNDGNTAYLVSLI